MTENSTTDTYAARGVSSGKEGVHKAIQGIEQGLYKDTFCKIIRDVLGNDPNQVLILHADGSGTKVIVPYLIYKRYRDSKVFRGVAVDSAVMNLDDMVCSGATGPFAYTQIINRNAHLISDEATTEIMQGTQEFFDTMRKHGIEISFAGGETADLGDCVRTLTLDGVMTARIKTEDIVHINIRPNDLIVGLASFGQSAYESSYNSGIGSNGLTDARHDLLAHIYAESFPEAYDPNTDLKLVYRGKHTLETPVQNGTYTERQKTVSPHEVPAASHLKDLLLSPTRTYAPVIKKVLNEIPRADLSGIIHCSGGGQTKVLKFISGVKIIKDNLFPIPSLFKLIQESSGKSDYGMYKTYNMGHRMEVYVRSRSVAEKVIAIAHAFGIDAQVVGHVEESPQAEVIIKKGNEQIIYAK